MPAHKQPIAERIAAKIKINSETGCHEWTAKVSEHGYGRVWRDGREVAAHRAAWELENGTIPEGLLLDHLCRNRRCCNPQHLEPVTPRENTYRSPMAPATINAAKTHCIAGHELCPDNLLATPLKYGARGCKVCHRERVRGYRAARRTCVEVTFQPQESGQ